MKNFYLLVALMMFAGVQGFSQSCTPNAATGSPGVSPLAADLACAERSQPYSATIYVENFNSFSSNGISGQVDSLRIDSLTNLPCGLSYVVNPPRRILHGGETGCININGTTTEAIGQYPIGIYLTVWVTATIPILGPQHQTYSGSAQDIISQIEGVTGPLGVNFNYWVRVKDLCSSVCAPLDTTSNSPNNLTAQRNCNPITDLLVPIINGPTGGCTGSNVGLKASFCGTPAGPVSYTWSNGNTGDSTNVTAPDTITLFATGASGYRDSITYIVEGLALPTAAYSVTATDSISVTFENTSAGSSSVVYIIDSASGLVIDSSNLINTSVTHTFTANGTYYLQTVSRNACGNDTAQNRVVYITGVPTTGLAEVNNINAFVSIYPNPSNGQVTLKIYSAVAVSENYTVKIYNVQGQEAFTQTMTGNVNKAIDLSHLGAGVYLVRINSTNLSTVQKLIIK